MEDLLEELEDVLRENLLVLHDLEDRGLDVGVPELEQLREELDGLVNRVFVHVFVDLAEGKVGDSALVVNALERLELGQFGLLLA